MWQFLEGIHVTASDRMILSKDTRETTHWFLLMVRSSSSRMSHPVKLVAGSRGCMFLRRDLEGLWSEFCEILRQARNVFIISLPWDPFRVGADSWM